jgi:hypothetical protein
MAFSINENNLDLAITFFNPIINKFILIIDPEKKDIIT